MITGLWSSASGMTAGSALLDALSVDLANLNTTGYKRNRVDFAEVAAEAQYRAGRTGGPGQEAFDWVRTAYGVAETASVRDFSQGTVLITGRPLDLAIEGDGFFPVRGPDGTIGYTRAGAFRRDIDGNVVDSSGRLLLGTNGQPMKVPDGATDIEVGSDGTVTAMVLTQVGGIATLERTTIGQVGVAWTASPETLLPNGGVFSAPAGTAAPALGEAGDGRRGTIRQGALEQSNVDMASALVALIIAQRAYTLSARAFSSADQMWNEANSLTG